jgi:hypothetical protein
MAGMNDIHYFTANIPTTGTVITPLFKNITDNGCITLVDGNIVTSGAGTITAYLVTIAGTGATAGTAVTNGTIGLVGSAAQIQAAGSVNSIAMTSPIVAPNTWVAFQMGAGVVGATPQVSIAYVKGKDGSQ